jgi:hypothetical protein
MKIPTMTMQERALNYPYEAPAGDYLVKDGQRLPLPESYDFSARTAVLSVGSNRAPVQLMKKFGTTAEVPVTEAVVTGCDVVHVAGLSAYGAVPCAPYPSKGSIVTLNIAWLTNDQLRQMHATESVGIAYDYVEWDVSAVTLTRDIKLDWLFGYASCIGAFQHAGSPFALSHIPAKGRIFPERSQVEMQLKLAALTGFGGIDIHEWVQLIHRDKDVHQRAEQAARVAAILPDNTLWRVTDIEAC